MTSILRAKESVEWGAFVADTIIAIEVLSATLQIKAVGGLPAILNELVSLVGDKVPPDKLAEWRAGLAHISERQRKGEMPDLSRLAMEMLVGRIVDRFELFLTQALSRRLRRLPASIGAMQVEVRTLLDCKDLDEAIGRAVEKKVYDLSFAGLPEIAEFLRKPVGVHIDTNSKTFEDVRELVEVRHLIAHHGGNVSRRFTSKTRRSDVKIGEPFPLDPQWILDGVRSLAHLAEEIYLGLAADITTPSNGS